MILLAFLKTLVFAVIGLFKSPSLGLGDLESQQPVCTEPMATMPMHTALKIKKAIV